MKIDQFKQLSGSRVEASITVAAEQIDQQAEELIKRASESIEVPGFRKGLAPRLLTIETIGLAELKRRLVTQLVSLAISELFTGKHLTPISEPQVRAEPFELTHAGLPQGPLKFHTSFEVMPAVAIRGYQQIKISRNELKDSKPKPVTDQDVELLLNRLRHEKADLIEVDRPIAKGDWVEISFEGKVDQVVQESLSSQHHPLVVGSGVLIPGFEDKLIGTRVGSKKTFQLKLPKQTKLIEFSVTIDRHRGVKLPELNDHFAGLHGQPNPEALRAHLKGVIEQERKHLSRHQREDLLIRKLLERTETELPTTLVERELERLIGRLRDEVLAAGSAFEDYLARQRETIESLRKKFRKQAEFAVKTGLALGEVAKREKIDPGTKEATIAVLGKLMQRAVQS